MSSASSWAGGAASRSVSGTTPMSRSDSSVT